MTDGLACAVALTKLLLGLEKLQRCGFKIQT